MVNRFKILVLLGFFLPANLFASDDWQKGHVALRIALKLKNNILDKSDVKFATNQYRRQISKWQVQWAKPFGYLLTDLALFPYEDDEATFCLDEQFLKLADKIKNKEILDQIETIQDLVDNKKAYAEAVSSIIQLLKKQEIFYPNGMIGLSIMSEILEFLVQKDLANIKRLILIPSTIPAD